MDERGLADFFGSQVGTAVLVHSVLPVGSGPLRNAYVADTSAGRFRVNVQVAGAVAMPIGDEFRLVTSLSRAGLPVGEPRWCELSGEVLGQPFFVTDARGGDEMADDPSGPTAADFVRTLARLHQLDADGTVPTIAVEHAVATQIEHWRNVGKSAGGSRVPLLDAAEMWLHKNIPHITRAVVVHGQPRPSNVTTSDGEVVAFAGWEAAHLGSAVEDWSYLATSNGSASRSRDWRALIEQEIGVRIKADEWTYWEAFNLFKTACIDRVCLAQFESGVNRSPQMMIAGTGDFHKRLRLLMNVVDTR